MSNHLKSAGNSLKKSSNNLLLMNIIWFISFLIVLGIETMNSDYQSKLEIIKIVNIISFLLIFILNFSFISNLNDSGKSLNLYSETLDLNSLDKTPTTFKQKTKNLKGEISKIKDSSGNFFLVVEDRRYYYDSESSIDKSIEHYNETGDLLEDGLLSSR
jgi:hypothetical protein